MTNGNKRKKSKKKKKNYFLYICVKKWLSDTKKIKWDWKICITLKYIYIEYGSPICALLLSKRTRSKAQLQHKFYKTQFFYTAVYFLSNHNSPVVKKEQTESRLFLCNYTALKSGLCLWMCSPLLPHGELHWQQPARINNRATICRNKFWCDKMPALVAWQNKWLRVLILISSSNLTRC